jgi:hypothetical protein
MKMKKEYIILGLIIIGLSVYLFLHSTDRTLYRLPVLPEVAKKEITRLQITKGATSIVLNKKDNNWYIAPQEYPAETNKVKDMLDNIEKLTLTALVSESKNYDRYDLNEGAGVNVKAWQGDVLKRDFDVGKTASSFRHTFVKLAQDDRVFHASGNFRNKFDTSADNLREKTVLSFKPADVQQIQLTQDLQTLLFTRTEIPAAEKTANIDKQEGTSTPANKTVWKTTEGQTGDDASLNRILDTLSNLRCDKFIDDRKKEDFTSPLYTVQLKGGQEYSLSIFAKFKGEDKNYPAVSSDSDYPFLLSSSQVDTIMKAPSEILKEPETAEKKSEIE